jgi:hypothetical protein
MRSHLAGLIAMGLVSGCTGTPIPSSGPRSCQPFGYTPAPIAFSFEPGPVSSSAAEDAAVALFRGCQVPGAEITGLISSSADGTGSPSGPNAGQAVWRVQVDATVSEGSPNSTHRSHFLIEVNQASGMPTIIGYG